MTRRSPRTFSFVALAAALACSSVYLLDAVFSLRLAVVLAFRPTLLAGVLAHGPSHAGDYFTIGTVWLSTLVHGDVAHLASNLAFLWFFGALLAQVAGERWVLAALVLTPLGSAAASVLLGGSGGIIGASGAISGLSGLYVLLAFRWDAPEVFTWPLARPVHPAQAALLAAAAAALDIYVLQSGVADGVARDSHLGGFAAGLLLGAVLTTAFPTWEAFSASVLGPGARASGPRA